MTTKDQVTYIPVILNRVDLPVPSCYRQYQPCSLGNILHFVQHICGLRYAEVVTISNDDPDIETISGYIDYNGKRFAYLVYKKFFSPVLDKVIEYPKFTFVGENKDTFNNPEYYNRKYNEALIDLEEYYVSQKGKKS